MKIAFYANEIAQAGSRGVKTYSLEIIKNLLAVDEQNEYFLYSQRDISSRISSDRAKFVVIDRPGRFWAFSAFAGRIKKDKPDAVFMPIQVFPFFNLRKNKPKVVVTVHDLAFVLFPEHFTFAKRKLLEFHTRRAVRFADRIIVPSEATKNDILRFYKVNSEKITVIHHGYSEDLLGLAEKKSADADNLTKNCPYVLFVGSVQPRKNIVRLVEAFSLLKSIKEGFEDLKLVICGEKGWMWGNTYAAIEKSPFRSDIIIVSGADNKLLAALYKKAKVFALPSLYEGFGLPILEAMSFGLPVVAANNSSLSEIVGDAGFLADGYSVEDIADKLKMALSSQELKAELSRKGMERAKQFSWEKAAKETMEVINSL